MTMQQRTPEWNESLMNSDPYDEILKDIEPMPVPKNLRTEAMGFGEPTCIKD